MAPRPLDFDGYLPFPFTQLNGMSPISPRLEGQIQIGLLTPYRKFLCRFPNFGQNRQNYMPRTLDKTFFSYSGITQNPRIPPL